MAQVLIFGDSITQGYWDVDGGWVQRLRKFVDEKIISSNQKIYHEIYNLGVSGDTSEDILKRFEQEIIARTDKDSEIIILIAIGTNDALFNNVKQSNWVALGKFKENIQALTEIGKKYTEKIVFVGLTPVDELRMDPVPWTPDNSAKNEYVQKYDEIITVLAKENGIGFCLVFEKFLAQDNYQSLLQDGDHPTSTGHEFVYETVKSYLLANKILEI